MAITAVASVVLTPAGSTGGTSAAIDTTGATLLVVSVGHFATVTVSDSKGNVWGGLTPHSATGAVSRLFCGLGATVGTGHTFTISGSGIFGAATVHAFAGVAAYQTESGNTSASSQPVASGSVTPVTDGALVITSMSSAGTTGTNTIAPAGFTQITSPAQGGISLQVSTGFFIQSPAAAINPTWSWSGAGSQIGVSTAVFLATLPPTATLSRVQATPPALTNTSAASVAVTFSVPPTVGNGVVVMLLAGGLVAATSVTDTSGNTYTLAKRQTDPSGPNVEECWWCAAITTTGATFTITAAGATGVNRRAVAIEVGGVGGGLAVEQSAGGTTAAPGSTAGPTSALTVDEVFLVAAVIVSNSSPGTITVAATIPAWTEEWDVTANAPNGEVDSKIILTGATGTTPSAVWTWTMGAANAASMIVAFKVTPGGGGSTAVSAQWIAIAPLGPTLFRAGRAS